MKTIVMSVLIGLAVAACGMLIAYPFLMPYAQPVPVPPVVESPGFLSLCSGVGTPSEAAKPIATAVCLGRISGFTTGHQLTVHMAAGNGANENDLKLWCVVHSKITDEQLYRTVALWANANPARLKEFVENEGSTNAAATMMFVAALHDAYPCTR
jgi:hypothetical protein